MPKPFPDVFVNSLPDAAGAEIFYRQFRERHPVRAERLLNDVGLLSDILTLTAFSPLFAATLLQNPEYVQWLKKHRKESKVRDKEELLDSLARFSMTNSQVEPAELLARFRRRELLRIYLRDIRRLGTIAEVTEEISHLADAILEYALRLARQELDNRFGTPLELDQKGRLKPATFCIVALGKLGSNELNYSSDIDLLFLYSDDGTTSGIGSRGSTSNREYFIKLSEFVVKLVGNEGGAYRVDLRLRPHGRVGALAVSKQESINYYQNSAQPWELQTLIRSRSGAGDFQIFKDFFDSVESCVFSANETVVNALQSVRQSKEKINREHATGKGFNVKLGDGGIREIEFIAQALQLAYGGQDKWLRAPHTLISLSRLADRGLLTENELTELSNAYDFFRRLEHRLQMENGLQTHIIPDLPQKRLVVAKRMGFNALTDFDTTIERHSSNVNRTFNRVFGNRDARSMTDNSFGEIRHHQELLRSIEKSPENIKFGPDNSDSLTDLSQLSPYFSAMLTANPLLLNSLPDISLEFAVRDYAEIFQELDFGTSSFARSLAVLRKTWSQLLLEIAYYDLFERVTIGTSKDAQTRLAEASLNIALEITKVELARRFGPIGKMSLGIMGLGKLGGRGMDYGSDLDLIVVYDEEITAPVSGVTHAEFYAKATEIFVTTLSSFTREGNLYRVDLRLRPDGKNGPTCSAKSAFINYFRNRAASWEWLAYVKIRGVAGDMNLALETEREIRTILHQKVEPDQTESFRCETLRMRERLEKEKTPNQNKREINIKFGAGGMLDVYFVTRFLQLRDNVPDDDEDRSTQFTLRKLFERGSLNAENYEILSTGYEFLSRLDHALRLTFGRSSLLPKNLDPISKRLKVENLMEILTLHRIHIRQVFEKIL